MLQYRAIVNTRFNKHRCSSKIFPQIPIESGCPTFCAKRCPCKVVSRFASETSIGFFFFRNAMFIRDDNLPP